jgi:hypothetical protein
MPLAPCMFWLCSRLHGSSTKSYVHKFSEYMSGKISSDKKPNIQKCFFKKEINI